MIATRVITRVALAILAASAVACAPASGPASATTTAVVSPDALMGHVNVLAADSMEGRRAGTPGNAKARAYVVRQFQAAGLQPLLAAGFEQPVSVRNPRDSSTRNAVNVVGMVRGRVDPARYIVVTAHYDHVGVRQGEIYNGADDNASGTAALVEIGRWFAANPPQHSIIFAALDYEEGGLIGARGFVASPPVPSSAIVLNVNMDMVGRNTKHELFAAGTSHYPYLRPFLDSVAARAPITLRFGHDDPNGPPADNWTSQSDHGAFHNAGIPFVYFGVEDHPDYHRPTDDAERLMPEFFAGAATTVLDAVRTLDRNLAAIASRPR